MKTQRTLSELRSALQRRLGFVATGSAAAAQAPILESFLQDAQESLWWQYDPPELRRTHTFTTSPGQTLYDWPSDFDLHKLDGVTVIDEAGMHRPLPQGVDAYHDSDVTSRTIPERFDIGPQLEIWPEPDDAYAMEIEYTALPARFTLDTDRASIDDSLLFLLALANAKAHYRHPDAKAYAQQAETALRAIQAKAHGQARYFKGRRTPLVLRRPGRVE